MSFHPESMPSFEEGDPDVCPLCGGEKVIFDGDVIPECGCSVDYDCVPMVCEECGCRYMRVDIVETTPYGTYLRTEEE